MQEKNFYTKQNRLSLNMLKLEDFNQENIKRKEYKNEQHKIEDFKTQNFKVEECKAGDLKNNILDNHNFQNNFLQQKVCLKIELEVNEQQYFSACKKEVEIPNDLVGNSNIIDTDFLVYSQSQNSN